jgi:lysophospholipase L1-like esterase
MMSAFSFKKKRTLFILGDSISLQYGTHLEQELAGSFTIQRKGSQESAMRNLDVPIDANGGDSRMVLSYLKTRVNDAGFKPDLMLLNCGLHDIKRNPSTQKIAVDSNEYRRNLDSVFQLLAAKKIPVIWVRTTEVIDSIHAEKSKAFNRYAKDVDQYNLIADEVCKQYGIAEIDLYTFTKKQGDDRFADHVHYIPRVIKEQALYIKGYVEGWKKNQKK